MPLRHTPVIGITCMDFQLPESAARYAQNQSYVSAVQQAGGAPFLIPHVAQVDLLCALYGRCDGILLPGGGDVEPSLYHQRPRPGLRSVSRVRDEMEMLLVQWALNPDAPKPLLAICRGIQVLNVALGGTLYQDLSQRQRETGSHDTQGQPRTYVAHQVEVKQPSLLHRVAGASVLQTNSFHHQAIQKLAPRLSIAARAPDRVVEAVEVQDHPFAVGVQWHPEELVAVDAAAQRLFDAFVASCRG